MGVVKVDDGRFGQTNEDVASDFEFRVLRCDES